MFFFQALVSESPRKKLGSNSDRTQTDKPDPIYDYSPANKAVRIANFLSCRSLNRVLNSKNSERSRLEYHFRIFDN